MKKQPTQPPEVQVQTFESASLRAWKKLEPRMTPKFKKLTMDFLINQYLFDIFKPSITGKQFSQIIEDWTEEAKSCGILEEYPFDIEIFQRTHPLADQAIGLAQKRLLRES